MNSSIVAPGIMLFTDVWDDYNKVISDIEEITTDPAKVVFWKRAVTGAKKEDFTVSEGRTNFNLILDSFWQNTSNHYMNKAGTTCLGIIEKVSQGLNTYKEKYNPETQEVPTSMIALRYQEGQEYKQHADDGRGLNRLVSFVMYLNDDYEGGNIEFPHFDYNLKPPANSMIFFPSNYIYQHIAHPVKSGTKYAIVNWIDKL